MSHELFRLASLIYNTPHLITEAYLDKATNYLEERNSGKELAVAELVNTEPRYVQYFPDKKLGIIDFSGAMTDIPHYSFSAGENLSHQSVREQMKSLVDSGVKTVVMDMDTPGGQCHMTFESALYLRDLADENDVKLISYVSNTSFSAGYAYSAVAHEIITNPSAEVGSIGVRVKLRNINGALKNMGIEDVYITAGENKVPYNSEGKFTEEFLSEVKESVLELYDQFTDHVAMYRGLSKEDVVALGANTFSSTKALSKGLVDKIMTLEEFKSYLDDITLGDTMTSPISNMFKSKKKDTEMSVDHSQLEEALTQLTAEFEVEKQAKSQLEVQLAKANTDLSAALSQLKVVEETRKAEKEATRLSQLTAVIGEAKAKEQIATMSSFDDNQFSSVLSLLSSSQKTVETSTLMSEIGDEGDDQDPASDMSYEDTIMAKLEAHRNKNKQ